MSNSNAMDLLAEVVRLMRPSSNVSDATATSSKFARSGSGQSLSTPYTSDPILMPAAAVAGDQGSLQGRVRLAHPNESTTRYLADCMPHVVCCYIGLHIFLCVGHIVARSACLPSPGLV